MGVIAEEAVRVRADTSGFHSELRGGVMGSIAKIAAGAGAALGGLAVGKALFLDPIKSAGDFQQSLNVLQATSGATNARMKEISATAMKLGADTKLPAVSASDAANAMLELAKGGFTAKQSMEAARGTLLLSTAAQIDGATAATMVADSLHAFGLRAKESSVVVDDFAGAANASTASMSEVGQSLQQSGQAFHQLGVPVGDAATAIAAMANAGIKGSDAGTSLKTMLQRLNPQTKQAKAEFQAMNVHTFDAHGKFLGLDAVIRQFSPKLRAMSQEQRSHALNVIFGSDASRAAGIILGQTGAHFDNLREKVTKAGQAQKLADAQTAGFKGALSALRSTIENVQLQIGLKLLPILTDFAHFLAANIPAAVAFVSSALTTMAGILTSIGTFLTENVGSWRQMAIALGIGAAAFVVLSAAVKAYTIVQAALNAVMAANPITIVIVAIAALVIGMTLLYQRSETARAIMNAAFEGIRSAAASVFGFITNTVIPNAIAAWQRFGPQVVATLQTAVSTIRAVVQAIATAVSTVVDQIKAHWDAIWSVFGPIVTTQLQVAKTAVQTVLNVIAGVIRVFAALLRGDWSGAWNALKGIVSDVLAGVISIVGSVLRGLATSAANLARLVGVAIGNGVKAGLSALAGLAGDLLGRIKSAATQAAGDAFNAMRQVGFSIADGVISGIGNLASRVASTVGDAAKGAVGGALGIITGHSPSKLYADTVGKSIGDGVTTGAAAAINAGVTRMNTALSTLGEKMGESLSRMAADVRTRVVPLTDAIADAAPKAAAKLLAKAKAAEKPIQDAFVAWIAKGKAAYDAKGAALIATVDAVFVKAQAKIDAWKAQATPTEALIALKQAQAAQAAVDGAVTASRASLAKLEADFATSWAKLLADQAKNMAQLKATQAATVTDTAIAGHEFDKSQTASQADPLATTLLGADIALIEVKKRYAAGTATMAELNAAVDAFDTAQINAANDTGAQKLLADYTTWQNLLAQEAAGAQGILDQQATDAQAQADAQTTHNDAKLGAEKAVSDALIAQQDAADKLAAEKERAAKDAAAVALNDQLVARHDRIVLHLKNVIHAHDLHFDELARMAARAGGTVGENLAQAMRDAIPLVDSAAQALANTVKKYLKTGSPTEAGPMSDLDRWWANLAPTLVQSLDGSSIKAALTDATTPQGRAGAGGRDAAARAASAVDTARMELLLERIHDTLQNQKPASGTEVNVTGIGIDVYRSRR